MKRGTLLDLAKESQELGRQEGEYTLREIMEAKGQKAAATEAWLLGQEKLGRVTKRKIVHNSRLAWLYKLK